MESAEASFVNMVMERLHDVELHLEKVEQQNDELKAQITCLEEQLDQRVPPLTLSADSGYTDFSDGYIFQWHSMMQDPKMSDERSIFRAVPLDEAHWNAVAFPGPVTIEIVHIKDLGKILRTIPKRFEIGQLGEPVTVRQLLTEFHRWMVQPLEVGNETTLLDALKAGHELPDLEELELMGLEELPADYWDQIHWMFHGISWNWHPEPRVRYRIHISDVW